jgi:hypothetical protein
VSSFWILPVPKQLSAVKEIFTIIQIDAAVNLWLPASGMLMHFSSSHFGLSFYLYLCLARDYFFTGEKELTVL